MADQLCWGVLGASDIAAAAVIPAIQASGNGRVVALASRDAGRARETARVLGIDRSYGSYGDLLADPTVEAVYIPLPNSLHLEWVRQAAAAGKAILCEKPLALSAAEAIQLDEACGRAGVALMEAFMYRFHPQTRRVHELVAEGAIGELREIRSHVSVDIMSPPDPANIRFDPRLGGGTLLDMGCYTVDLARQVFGETPQRVRGWLDFNAALGVDVAMAAILEFSGGRVGMPSSSFRAGAQGAYAIIGTKGVIEVPRGFIPGLGSRVAETVVILADADGRRHEEHFASVDHYRLMAEAFADAMLNGKPVPFLASDSVQNMRVLDAISRAARRGAAEEV
jgi:D-xylose 1-dehydrogenase (NADP+, D-xylono-1,5-lactone-forming)